MNIVYEKHPITDERKAELMAKGYRILDARFDPKEDKQDIVKKRGRKAKVD